MRLTAMRLTAMRLTAARSTAARSTAACSTALCGSALDGGTLDGGTAAEEQRHIITVQQLLRAKSPRTLDGGTLVGGMLFGDTHPAARALRRHARRRHARRRLHAQRRHARRRHCCRRKKFLTCFTEPWSSPSSLDAIVITASLSDLCVPFGGRRLCTSRIIYLRVASPAVTSVGTSSKILRQKQPPSTPIHPHCRPSTSTSH